LEKAVMALRQADERKNAFLYTLTHELRGPLGTFGNCLTLLEQFPKLDAIRSVMGRQFSQLTYLVNDMSDLAAISLGKMTMRFVDIDLRTVVQNAAETVEPAMRKREQVFEVHLPNDEVTVVGDSMRLVQSVKNLLSNASRYTQRGGTIKVELMASRAHATISVTDNGQGISANALPYIFNMYEQVAGVDKGGLGIGLALVKRISEMHGGSVSLTSVEGRGSTFVLTLPLKKETIGTAA
jgi:signal transduction histidine kinase